MTTPHIKIVSRQSTDVYRLLTESNNLTARQVAEQLNILPNTVYRAVRPLVALGMVEVLPTYPISYKVSPREDAINWYLRAAARGFRQDFGTADSIHPDTSLPRITFIKDRTSMLAISEQETRKATKTINYIVSGHLIPDSTVLAYRKATTTGVKVRCIVQNNPATTNAGLEMYEDMGVEVRYLPNIGIRLFIYDDTTAVLTSYDDEQSDRAFGIRFTYPPVAEQLSQLFEQRWVQAQPLSSRS